MADDHDAPPLSRDVLVRLHGALLPATVPLLAHADVAATYLVSNRDQTVGGDWFDACVTVDGRLALAVGDVVGTGIQSSVTMSDLRSVLGSHLQDGTSVAESLAVLDRIALRAPHAFASSVCVAVLDPRTGELEYATRGHPPPLVVTATGATTLPATAGGTLGGSDPGTTAHAVLPLGAALVLCTDGLVDHPGASIDASWQALSRAAAAALGDDGDRHESAAVRLCRRVPAELGADGFDDDVTLLVAHRRPAPAPLDVRTTAQAASLGPLRGAIGRWGASVGLTPRDAALLELAVSETAANSVEHAYRGVAPGPVSVHAELDDTATVTVTVTDAGTWQEPSSMPSDRGRGLAMARMGGVDVQVDTGASGTCVTLRLPARRRVPLDVGPARASTRSDVSIDTAQVGVVRVGGVVDRPEAASRVSSEVNRQSRGGLLPVTVELGDLTFLGSIGVRALQTLTDAGAPGGAPVTLVAAAGSRAAGTLRLAGLPFETTLLAAPAE
ncbi:ATP-binding SpoIIE family protein phosphatase [Cellulomonas fimi]|nr:SpoIIE family protein phosphatase [Cellulomonas fimi]NNH08181.1 SpoIIE family protein phosphatase [Cellulomonas fimi]